jgi:hypothetical protein
MRIGSWRLHSYRPHVRDVALAPVGESGLVVDETGQVGDEPGGGRPDRNALRPPDIAGSPKAVALLLLVPTRNRWCAGRRW